MSTNPRDGVTNAWGRAHDVKNLFVSDGSALSPPGAANPTLTATTTGTLNGDTLNYTLATTATLTRPRTVHARYSWRPTCCG